MRTVNATRHILLSTPAPPPALPADEADEAFALAFQEWDCLRASVVAVAGLCAEAWTEGDTPIAEHLDRLCNVTSPYKDADAVLNRLYLAADKRPRLPRAT